MTEQIDWKAIVDAKSEELRKLYAELASLRQELAMAKVRDGKRQRQAMEIAFLRAENALLKYDLKRQDE